MTREELRPFFEGKALVTGAKNQKLGLGVRESELIEQGFTKQELKKLARAGLLEKIQCRSTKVGSNGGAVNVYLFKPDNDVAQEIAKKG